MVQTTPHGSWHSPITSDLIVSSSIRLGAARLDGADIYWSELRPTEGGTQRLVRYGPEDPLGSVTEITPPEMNVRSRVHEYGGGAYAVHQGTVYFSNFADQRLYCQKAGEDPVALTPPVTPAAGLRYADMVVDASRDRLICVVEDHRQSGEAINAIAAIPLAIPSASPQSGPSTGSLPEILVSGNDFYASPRISPDGKELAWVTWNHPQMPWDGTELWLADINEDGSLSRPRRLVGNEKESVCQPKWSPAGTLHFISDATGWWNLYRWEGERGEPLFPMEAEFAGPQWSFGQSSYGFIDNSHILCTYQYQGETKLAELDTLARSMDELDMPYSGIGSLQVGRGFAVFMAASKDKPSALVRLNLETGQTVEIRKSSSLEIDPGYLSEPTVISFPTTGGFNAYGIYYRPQNKDFEAEITERPPLLVKTHGGPTAAASSALNLSIQYWTSRGFAVLDVNYGGSSGYGRAYRNRLQKRWGIVDIDDAVNGALYLVEQGKADRDRLAIDGGSAGGYTTLAALTFRDVFKAGASYYGVSDMTSLAAETHKFESRYLDSLVGPYPAEKAVYEARSPINAVDQLSCPIIFFQGSEDRIVPPNQAETMVNALKEKGIPVAYLLFEGEQHGFRKAENIKRSLDAELSFYAQIFGFELADEIEPVEIVGLNK